jgi:secreted PhoX family phosphatase
MDRRQLLRTGAIATGALAFGGSLWRSAWAAPATAAVGPYGALQAADPNGIRLPAGFGSRVIARTGQAVPGTSYLWHGAPDGGATFATQTENGWIYVSNSELNGPDGGASAIRFAGDGRILNAYRILGGTDRNCAGGPTLTGSTPNTAARWLSGEEVSRGMIWECDPRGHVAAVARPAMGKFTHEAAAVDPVRKVVYLTEDKPDGCFYRFLPTRYPDLSSGVLEVLCASTETGPVSWKPVPDPSANPTSTRYQVSGVHRFAGGEGCWYEDDVCYFTTKHDNRVWAYDAASQSIDLFYDDDLAGEGAELRGVDNLTMSRAKDLYVAEDGDDMQICMITPDETVSSFLQLEGHGGSELTGVAFNPAGNRLYFSSQRGTDGAGVTFEVYGPFRS